VKNINRKINLILLLFLFFVIIIFFIAGCASIKHESKLKKIPPDFVPAKHLVFIGLDGWGGAYVSKANMPTVKRMMSNGAWCLTALNVLPGQSWPNWTSLFCGAPPEKRGKKEFPSIFTLVENNGQKSAFFYEWTELGKICSDSAAEKQEIFTNLESAQKIAASIKEQKPFFTAVVFNEPDATGHARRWGSVDYYAKLAQIDGFIAIIEQAVKDAEIYDDTIFVLSADHGGSMYWHESNTPIKRNIPLIVFGDGIKEGFKIISTVNIYDIAPTMAALMGMEIPPEWTGRLLHEIFK